MNPPTANELVGPPPHGLDEKWALGNFLGKSQAEAKAMFRHGAVTEDFTYMAAEGLRYYLPATLEYLRSKESADDSDFAEGLMCSLYCQMTSSQSFPADVVSLIKEIALFCDTHRGKFGLAKEEQLFDDYIRTIATV